MKQFTIFLENMNDVHISDIQELNNSMRGVSFNKQNSTHIDSFNEHCDKKPLIDNKFYYIDERAKIIEINYFDMLIKLRNDQGSTLIGQIIDGLDIVFDIPANIHIVAYKKNKESYYIYGKY